MPNSRISASHWGVLRTKTVAGRLVGVEPDPADRNQSFIGRNFVDACSDSSRIRRPAVRKGYLDNGPQYGNNLRGAEPFVEVSWDNAIDLAANAVADVRRRHGNQAIFGGSYGWASAGRFHHAQSQIHRFLNSCGGYVASIGNYSFQAALILMPYIVGDYRKSLRSITRWKVIAEHGRLVVAFGGISSRTTQISSGGVGRHRLREQLLACRRAGVTFVNVSPLRTDLAEELQAEWLAPRPGSDTAMMMGLAHTLLEERLHDRAFLDRHAVGFGRVAAYLTGASDGVTKSADWAAGICGIDAGTIRDLARRMAAGPTLITTATALQRAECGEQPLWMTVTLAAMLGQIGIPGGGFGIGYGADAAVGVSEAPLRWPSLPQGDNPIRESIPVAAIADMLLYPGREYDFNGQRSRYPDIRMVWWAGGNPFHHHQDLNRLVKAFRQPETIIVNEIGWTATARHADIVLPVTTPLERSDFSCGSMDTSIVPMPASLDPIGQARDDYEIFCAIAERLGCAETFSEGRSARDWLEWMWEELRKQSNSNDKHLPDFQTFLAGDAIHLDDPRPDAVFLAEFRADPQANPLPTPSGKIELFSQTIESFGYRDCPGHAVWLAPKEWLGAASDYPLHLLSGQPATRLHSQLDSGSYSREGKIAGREPVLIHPDDAGARGISDGDVVRIFNGRGACLAGARITNDIRPGVVFLWTGAWFDPVAPGTPGSLEKHGNPNVLTHDLRTSSLSQGPASHSALVDVERYSEPPPVTAFDPPAFAEAAR